MALVTENGWVQCSRAQCETRLVPGTSGTRIEIQQGTPSIILTAWAAWWHRNVRTIDRFKPRDYWGWSGTNDVWNSNHLSGTAIDLNATELPWQKRVMSANERATVARGLTLFEGHIYWGGNWTRVDEMHTQMAGNTRNNPKTEEFAQRLLNGYLNIYGPADPNAFPLPNGYYYGPLWGPIESISCEYASDSQTAKDGLGRWQEALGIPVTKKWNDGVTPKAAMVMQAEFGWPSNPWFGYGGVYLAEWTKVIRDGWRLPADFTPADWPEPGQSRTLWGDYSQYQSAHIDASYPYEIVSFRSSVADATRNDPGSSTGKAGLDNKFLENMRRAKALVAEGKLKKIIAYHFWVPGCDNWGTFKDAIDRSGGVFPELACMLDVEDGGAKWNVKGDQTAGVKEWIARAREYFDNDQAVSIYLNFVTNADLIKGINDEELYGVKLIVPSYHDPKKWPYTPEGVVWFAHQYTDRQSTPPFGPSDMNQARMPLDMFLHAWGTNNASTSPPPVEPPEPPGEIEGIPDEDMTEVAVLLSAQFGVGSASL